MHQEIQCFEPNEQIDGFVHEFFGLHVLEALCFQPRLVLPDRAILMGGLTWTAQVADETVTSAVV